MLCMRALELFRAQGVLGLRAHGNKVASLALVARFLRGGGALVEQRPRSTPTYELAVTQTIAEILCINE